MSGIDPVHCKCGAPADVRLVEVFAGAPKEWVARCTGEPRCRLLNGGYTRAECVRNWNARQATATPPLAPDPARGSDHGQPPG